MSTAKRATRLTITLPNDVLEIIRAKVSSGEYADESAVVEAALIDLLLPPASGVTDEWLRREALPALDRLEADPSTGRTPEQVLGHLRERHNRLRKAG